MYNQKRILELQQKFASKWAGITFGKVRLLVPYIFLVFLNFFLFDFKRLLLNVRIYV